MSFATSVNPDTNQSIKFEKLFHGILNFHMKEIRGNYSRETQNYSKLGKIPIAHITSSNLPINQNEMLIGKIAQYNQLLNVTIINNLKSDEIHTIPEFGKLSHTSCSPKFLHYPIFKNKGLSGGSLYIPLHYVYYDSDSADNSNEEHLFRIINKNSLRPRLGENPMETSDRSTIYHHSMNIRKLAPHTVMYWSNGTTSYINRPTVPYPIDQLPVYLSSRVNFQKSTHVCHNCYMRQSKSINGEFQPMIVHDMTYSQTNNGCLNLLFIKLRRFTKLIQRILTSQTIVCSKAFKSCSVKKSILSDYKQEDVKFFKNNQFKTTKSKHLVK
uniref:Smp_200520 n=2 Tax=Schistosoma mansoni TaxID=6183 RepID=A0A3Q0KUV7_SCHMA